MHPPITFSRHLFRVLLLISFVILIGDTSAHRVQQEDPRAAAAERTYQAARELNARGTPEALRASIEKFKEAGELFRATGDKGRAALMLLFIAHTHYDLGEQQKAVEISSEAQIAFHALGNARMEANAFSLMGGAYLELDNKTKAIESYTQELTLWQSIDDKKSQALALSNIGLAYYLIGDKEKALDYYDKAIGFVNDVDDPAIKARLFGSLGELHAELGRYEFAKGFLQVAIGIHKRLGNDKEANRLTSVLNNSRAAADTQKTGTGTGVTGQPELVVQLGHSSAIRTMSFSPDGRYVVTGGQDNTARLWETATGLEIRKFEGHRAVVLGVAFTPDGRNILTSSADASVRLWDLATGKQIRQFTGEREEMTSVTVSNDGRMVAAGNGMTVRLWELAAAREVRNFPMSSRVNSVAFSPDGKRVVVGTGASLDPSRIKEWMLKTQGKTSVSEQEVSREVIRQSAYIKREVVMLETETGHDIWRFAGLASPVQAVAFSSDGSLVLSASGGREGGDNVAHLFDSATGRELRHFTHEDKLMGPEPLLDVSFSPDGRQALTVGIASARVWDLSSGAAIRRLEHPARQPFCGAFSREGLIAIAYSQTADLYEASTGSRVRSLEGYAYESSVMAVSPDGKFIATGNYQVKETDHIEPAGTICLWDIASGKEVRRFDGHQSSINSLIFSKDNRLLLSGSTDRTARLWDLESGKEVVRFETKAGEGSMFAAITSVALSSDGRFAVAGFENVAASNGESVNYARMWETASGREIQKFPHQDGINSVAFSPDSRFVLTGSGGDVMTTQGTLEDRPAVSILWDRESGREIRRFAGNRAVFSPDGKFVLTAGLDNAAHLWETETGREVRSFAGHTGDIEALAFSNDGRLIVTGSLDQTARVWDAETGTTLKVLAAHEGHLNSVAIPGEGRFVFTLAGDSIARVWNRETGDELCRLISFRDGTWVTVDPAGRFDTNNLEEIRGLHWSISDEPMKPLPLEIFMREYYEPRLVQRIIGGEKFKPVKSLAELNRLQPFVRITKIEPQPGQPDQVTVTVEVAQAADQVGQSGKSATRRTDVYDLRLFRDGQLVGQAPSLDSTMANETAGRNGDDDLRAWRQNTQVKLSADGKASIKFENIRLPRPQNTKQVEFSAYAFNVDKVKSLTDKTSFDVPQDMNRPKGRAYVITVGVNAYENSDFDLEFAAADARRMQQVMTERLAASGQYEEIVPVSLISDYEIKGGQKVATVKQATKENIRAVLQLLSKRNQTPDTKLSENIPNLDKLRAATPDDLVLIMFSSHGYADRDGNFYFIPYDTGPGAGKIFRESVRRHSISSEELSYWLAGVDAGEMVMIVDACHSAAAIEGPEFKPGPMGSRGLGQLSYDKGMRILTATQSDTVALENNLIRQGLLTYALLRDGIEALQADYKPPDNSITLSEWLSYGVDRVPKLYDEVLTGRVQNFGLANNQTRVVKTSSTKELVEVVNSATKEAKTQQPSLFDFARRRRDLVLLKRP
jgi:WD40 repeat protein